MLPQPFEPTNSTLEMSVGATSGQFVLAAWKTPEGGTVRIANRSAFDVYVRGGDGSVVASTTDIPVLARSVALLTLKGTHTFVGVISPDGGATVLLTQGRYGSGG